MSAVVRRMLLYMTQNLSVDLIRTLDCDYSVGFIKGQRHLKMLCKYLRDK